MAQAPFGHDAVAVLRLASGLVQSVLPYVHIASFGQHGGQLASTSGGTAGHVTTGDGLSPKTQRPRVHLAMRVPHASKLHVVPSGKAQVVSSVERLRGHAAEGAGVAASTRSEASLSFAFEASPHAVTIAVTPRAESATGIAQRAALRASRAKGEPCVRDEDSIAERIEL